MAGLKSIMRLLVLFLVLTPLLRANALDALRARLAGLDGTQPVRAVVEYAFTSREGDAATEERGKASVVAEEGPTGLSLFWAKRVLATASAELEAHARNPEIRTPTRHILQTLDAERVYDYFHAAQRLQRGLEGAQLVSDAGTLFEGRPARLLTVRLKPKLNVHDRKYVKQADFTERIWTDATGVPLAADMKLIVRGRALLVITFETSERERYWFMVTGGRLLVTRQERESSGSGGGERNLRSSVTNLTYECTGGRRQAY